MRVHVYVCVQCLYVFVCVLIEVFIYFLIRSSVLLFCDALVQIIVLSSCFMLY